MQLDIRLPMGMLFAILGLLLTVYGATADSAIYERSLGYNVNLVWGMVLVAFGAAMLALGWRRRSATVRTADVSPEGRATEQREREQGLESDGPR